MANWGLLRGHPTFRSAIFKWYNSTHNIANFVKWIKNGKICSLVNNWISQNDLQGGCPCLVAILPWHQILPVLATSALASQVQEMEGWGKKLGWNLMRTLRWNWGRTSEWSLERKGCMTWEGERIDLSCKRQECQLGKVTYYRSQWWPRLTYYLFLIYFRPLNFEEARDLAQKAIGQQKALWSQKMEDLR